MAKRRLGAKAPVPIDDLAGTPTRPARLTGLVFERLVAFLVFLMLLLGAAALTKGDDFDLGLAPDAPEVACAACSSFRPPAAAEPSGGEEREEDDEDDEEDDREERREKDRDRDERRKDEGKKGKGKR